MRFARQIVVFAALACVSTVSTKTNASILLDQENVRDNAYSALAVFFDEVDWQQEIDVSSAEILLTSGQSFVMGFEGSVDTRLGIRTWGNGTVAGGPYDGDLYLKVGSNSPAIYNNGIFDFQFRTFVDDSVNPVPEPSSIAMWSLLSVCGVAFRRR